MERKNKDTNPIYYKSAEEMDKPMSELINELRSELSRTRGKLHDIKRSFGWDEWVENYEGGLTCMISAMSNFQDELKRVEDKHRLVAEKV
jgi:NifU-like protein involved in Fe-S cluster formation